MTSFVMLDDKQNPVTDWDFDGPQTWKIYPVAPETKGTARAVFSLLVRNQSDAEVAQALLADLNNGVDMLRSESLCVGKVTKKRDWDRIDFNGGNKFEIQYPNPHLAATPIERARHLASREYSETWHIVVNSDFKGTQRPVFSFVVKGGLETRLVLDVVEIFNRSDRPNFAHCPFFCKGKVSTKKDFEKFEKWIEKNSTHDALFASERIPF